MMNLKLIITTNCELDKSQNGAQERQQAWLGLPDSTAGWQHAAAVTHTHFTFQTQAQCQKVSRRSGV